MSTSDTQRSGPPVELKIVGRVLNTLGVVFLSICVALAAALLEDLSVALRTAGGIAVAAAMVLGGQALSQRRQSNWWFPTTLMSAGYALAYFFCYSTYYVAGLKMLDHPYTAWVLGLTLGALGTWHGTQNRHVRWFTSVFTAVITGHAYYHALSAGTTLYFGGYEVKVAAIACFIGMLWCAGMSSAYKRLELSYRREGGSMEETANWWLHNVLHEVYFVAAAISAMILPVFLQQIESAPLWWAIQAPILLALSWRNGNIVKHGIVALIWFASALTMLNNAISGSVDSAVLLSVPLSGTAMGLAYRFVKSRWEKNLSVLGYCFFLYGAVLVSIVGPYLQTGNIWNAMPYWMIQSLALCGMGLALRDKYIHDAGWITALGSLVLFALQWQTWSWGLVAPVIIASYGLSVAYAYISRQGGWKQTSFLPFEVRETISTDGAWVLEQIWSWVGCAVLLFGTLRLLDNQSTAIWWSLEAFLLVALGFAVSRIGFRLQGLFAYGLAAGKLIFFDVSGGVLGLSGSSLTLFNAFQFGIVGASALVASFLYFREEARLRALSIAEENNEQKGDSPTKTDDKTDDNSDDNSENQ